LLDASKGEVCATRLKTWGSERYKQYKLEESEELSEWFKRASIANYMLQLAVEQVDPKLLPQRTATVSVEHHSGSP
jgi:hypothetical protein